MPRFDVRLIIAGYFSLQAFGTFAWWTMLLIEPTWMEWFQPSVWPKQVLISFLVPDLLFLVIGSLLTAYAVLRQRVWSTLTIWSTLMAGLYPTFFCIAASVQTGEAWIAAALMSAMSGLMLAMATIHGTPNQSPAAIRVTEMPPATAILWTAFQVAIFWSIFLWILPLGVNEFEQRLGWPAFVHPGQTGLSMTLFLIASVGGLWSGWTLASRGNGTPLPTATAAELVIAGPYRYVRNPMALTGVVQGAAIGWQLGSYTLIAGAILCGCFWHLIVRPVEEADLHQRFGSSYADYQKAVGLWIPRVKPYGAH